MLFQCCRFVPAIVSSFALTDGFIASVSCFVFRKAERVSARAETKQKQKRLRIYKRTIHRSKPTDSQERNERINRIPPPGICNTLRCHTPCCSTSFRSNFLEGMGGAHTTKRRRWKYLVDIFPQTRRSAYSVRPPRCRENQLSPIRSRGCDILSPGVIK